jgi:hypothetical protein
MPEARKREPVVPAKVKIVVKELLDQRVYDLAAAAAKAGLTTYLARRYLKRPNVLRYFREERAPTLGADHSHGVEQCVAAMCSDAHSDRSHWRFFMSADRWPDHMAVPTFGPADGVPEMWDYRISARMAEWPNHSVMP